MFSKRSIRAASLVELRSPCPWCAAHIFIDRTLFIFRNIRWNTDCTSTTLSLWESNNVWNSSK